MIRLDENTYEITMTQYDFGVPITLDAYKADGFNVGERVVFVFRTDKIASKMFDIDEEEYKINLVFDEAEVNRLFDRNIETHRNIRYSIKRYKWDEEQQKYQFLESLENDNGESVFNLKVTGTVRYNGEAEST